MMIASSPQRGRILAGLCWVLIASLSNAASGAEAAGLEHFEKVIRPLLVKHCYECHSHQSKRLEANLYLDSRDGLLRGGDSGAVIVPGEPEQSLLVEAIRYESNEMPPKGKLPEAEIQALVDWVRNKAPWPQEPAPVATRAEKIFNWQERKQSHWSWQPLQHAPPPEVKQQAWPRQELDRFILARLESIHLQPAAPADPRTWLRRVYFDLIGLPPAPEQLQAFLADERTDARERVVEDLLCSPRFGEKWARHWMDLVRYAEGYGHEFDFSIPHAYQYRDYLIRAFNADVPYDQLVREQIAGDLLEHPRLNPDEGYNESLIGTGFWFLGEAVHAPTDVRSNLSTRVENQIDVFSRAFLGLSVACARCHDHKFDAISKEDYYALYGILNSSHRDIAWLDPNENIAETVQNIDSQREIANRALQQGLEDNSISEEMIADYLRAAFEVLDGFPEATEQVVAEKQQSAIQQAAGTLHLDAAVLSRWVAALSDGELRQPLHPLYSLSLLSGLPEPAIPVAREKLAEEMNSQAQAALAARQQQVLFANFDTANWEGWQTTGFAFGSSPVQGLQVNWSARSPEVMIPGTVSGSQRSTKLRGSLRSPLFTLEHPFLHSRIRGNGVTIRLVVENYFMDQFQSLLFSDMTRKEINTEGKWVWITQGGDLKNHLGARAYLEILDHGDGSVEFDEIWFSGSSAPPAAPPSKMSIELANDSTIASRAALADACGAQWAGRLRSASLGDVTTDSAALINWLLRHRLIELPAACLESSEKLRAAAEAIPIPIPVLASVDGPGLDEPVHIRGSDENFGPVVPRRFLVAIAGEDQPVIEQGSGRLELANRVTAQSNPFLSRVLVNRLWHHLFGRGLVPSVDDFGAMGQAPSHPELLDWLTNDFQEHGYSIKHALRAMVLSSTYGMSSSSQADRGEEMDPDNRLLRRMSIRRLPAESLRDAMLMDSGRLDLTMSGPSVPVYLTAFMTGRGRPATAGPLDGAGRRSVYQEIRRNFLSPMMLAFDMPSPFSCMGRRSVSNVPAQSLILMNDPFVAEQAQLWAERVLAAEPDPQRRIANLFETAFARPADSAEQAEISKFLEQQAQLYGCDANDPRIWADLCHMLFNMKEFLFLQ